MARSRRSLGLILLIAALGMLAFSFAAVPLYRIFCQKTGFGGTPKIAAAGANRILDRRLTVRFDASVSRDMPWTFTPNQTSVSVRLGEQGLAFYHVKNEASYPVVGMATYNVTPDKAGAFFNKIECFCFVEQRLEPGQEMDMPVSFFIDPDLDDDLNLKDVDTITLSYTFFPLKNHPVNQR